MTPLLLSLAVACATTGDSATTAAGTTPTLVPGEGTGTLALTFAIDPDWKAAMDEPAVGAFYGSFWRGDEVDSLGPMEGAEDLGGIEVPTVDLSATDGPTPVLFTSGPLPDFEVIVLGFLDSDANAEPGDPGPDVRDPVTLPNENDFDVVRDAQTEVAVFFGFLNP